MESTDGQIIFNAPKNFKQGRLLFNRFRPVDLAVNIGCVCFSLLSTLIYLTKYEDISIQIVLLFIAPAVLSLCLTIPCGVYHNILTALVNEIKFQTKNNTYIWEGIYKDDNYKKN